MPAIPCPAQNTSSSIAVSTSVGFRHLDVEDYIEAVQELRPDIAISIADIIPAQTASTKRIEKSADRTHAWLRDTVGANNNDTTRPSATFASIPSIEKEQQSFYLADLVEEFQPQLSGLTIYDPAMADSIPKEISSFPRLCLSEPSSPHAILDAISLGVDLITVPFVTTFSEYGIAFSFAFVGYKEMSGQSLGVDLWSTDYITDLSPPSAGCKCYTCQRHHRAYIHHLLQAKEMLAWTLLGKLLSVHFGNYGYECNIDRNIC